MNDSDAINELEQKMEAVGEFDIPSSPEGETPVVRPCPNCGKHHMHGWFNVKECREAITGINRSTEASTDDRVVEARRLLWEEAEAVCPDDPDRQYDIIIHEQIRRADAAPPSTPDGVRIDGCVIGSSFIHENYGGDSIYVQLPPGESVNKMLLHPCSLIVHPIAGEEK